jgi:hypothetical protein
MTHPLFPYDNEDEDDTRDISWIHVTRFERTGQTYAPRLFGADELTSLEEVQQQFGGGSYELIARSEDRSRITARKRYTLPGTPLPLAESIAEPSPGPAVPAGRPGPALDSNGGLLMAFLQMSAESNRAQMQMMMQFSQAQMQMAQAMIQSGRGDSAAMVAAMAKLSESDKATMAQFFAQMAQAKQNSGGEGALVRGMEMGLEMAKASASDDGSGELNALVEGFKAYVEMQKGGGAPAVGPKE